MYKTSKEDFELFQNEALRFQTLLGLKNWHISFEHTKIPDCHAQVTYNAYGRKAILRLAKRWCTPSNANDISKAAFHEMLELMLGPIRRVAQTMDILPDVRSDLMDTEVHNIIRIFENVIHPLLKE